MHGVGPLSLGVLYHTSLSTEHQSGSTGSSMSCPAVYHKMVRQKCDKLLSGVLSTQQNMWLRTAIILLSLGILGVMGVLLHSTKLESGLRHMRSWERFALSLLICQICG